MRIFVTGRANIQAEIGKRLAGQVKSVSLGTSEDDSAIRVFIQIAIMYTKPTNLIHQNCLLMIYSFFIEFILILMYHIY